MGDKRGGGVNYILLDQASNVILQSSNYTVLLEESLIIILQNAPLAIFKGVKLTFCK